LEGHGEDAAEAAWLSALALVDRATGRAREGQYGRWSSYPGGELRRLRRELAAALRLARFAVLLQETENERLRDLTADLRRSAAEAGARARREGTREAERVRLENAARRRLLAEQTAPKQGTDGSVAG
jgi:hypothetical protein